MMVDLYTRQLHLQFLLPIFDLQDTVHGGCPVYQGTKMIAITEYKALLQQDVCPINEE